MQIKQSKQTNKEKNVNTNEKDEEQTIDEWDGLPPSVVSNENIIKDIQMKDNQHNYQINQNNLNKQNYQINHINKINQNTEIKQQENKQKHKRESERLPEIILQPTTTNHQIIINDVKENQPIQQTNERKIRSTFVDDDGSDDMEMIDFLSSSFDFLSIF